MIIVWRRRFCAACPKDVFMENKEVIADSHTLERGSIPRTHAANRQ